MFLKSDNQEKARSSLELRAFVHWLRRLDSNERPPGYEPGELPTAPLRDVVISFLRVQRYEVFLIPQNFYHLFCFTYHHY